MRPGTARSWPAPPRPEKEQTGKQFHAPAGINGLTGKGMGASAQPLRNSDLTQLPSAYNSRKTNQNFQAC